MLNLTSLLCENLYCKFERASSEVEKRFEVVSDVREIFPYLLVCNPVIQSCSDVALPDVEHVLGITSAGFLKTPGGGVVEVKFAATASSVVLLEVVAHLSIWEGCYLSYDRVDIVVVLLNVAGVLEIFHVGAVNLLL